MIVRARCARCDPSRPGLRLHVAPMLLGGGTALFEGVTPELRLVANEAASKAGAMHLSYAVDNSNAP